MLHSFAILDKTRANIAKAVKGLSLEQLNTIPSGMNNNIIWNVGHLVATQQLLSYGLSGIEPFVPKKIIEKYRKGTKPNGPVDQKEVDDILSLLHNASGETIKAILDGDFVNFKQYATSFGITLNNLEEAVAFNNVHEGMHLGNILVMKKLV